MAQPGYEGKLYINSGSFGSPTWTEVDITVDASMDSGHNRIDASARKGGGTKEEIAGLTTKNLTFQILKEKADAQFETLRDAHDNKTTADVAYADAAIATSGTEYTRFEGQIFGWNEAQPLDGVMAIDVEIGPTPNANAAPSFNETA